MGLREWIDKLRGREDAEALQRAQSATTETADERAASRDVEGIAADVAAEEHGGEPPAEG